MHVNDVCTPEENTVKQGRALPPDGGSSKSNSKDSPRRLTSSFVCFFVCKGGSGSCLEATWHGARVAVKRLLPPVKFGSGGGVGSRIGAGRGGNATRLFSAAEASAVRREMRALQSLRFDFLLPIYGVRTSLFQAVAVFRWALADGCMNETGFLLDFRVLHRWVRAYSIVFSFL